MWPRCKSYLNAYAGHFPNEEIRKISKKFQKSLIKLCKNGNTYNLITWPFYKLFVKRKCRQNLNDFFITVIDMRFFVKLTYQVYVNYFNI